MSKYEVGNKFTNKKGLEFEIIEKLENRKRRIRFLNTGYEVITNTSAIYNQSIRDILSPSICGIGVSDMLNSTSHPLYERWRQMILRCYDESHYNYANYGAKGITVCKEWHMFSNYVKDIEKKENYDKLLKDGSNWHVDKDMLSSKNKVYSNETTLIVSISENSGFKNSKL